MQLRSRSHARLSSCGIRSSSVRSGFSSPRARRSPSACRRAGQAVSRWRAARRRRSRSLRWRADGSPAAVSRGSTPQSPAWISRFRRPVRERSTTGSWKTTLLTPRAASGSFATSKPATRALPAVGSIVVVSMRTVVDLPAARSDRASLPDAGEVAGGVPSLSIAVVYRSARGGFLASARGCAVHPSIEGGVEIRSD